MSGPGSGQEGGKQEALLDEVLRKAVAKPRLLATSDGGAVLIVALHCLMVKAGFQLVYAPSLGSGKQQDRPVPGWQMLRDAATWLHSALSPFSMGLSWNGSQENAWMLEYTRRDAPGTFVMHCSLAHSMMIVCGSEVGNPDNVNMLSLQLGKYVPELAACRQSSWSGVIRNQGALSGMFSELVSGPLAARALRPSEPPGSWPLPSAAAEALGSASSSQVAVGAAVVALGCATAAAAAVALSRASSSSSSAMGLR